MTGNRKYDAAPERALDYFNNDFKSARVEEWLRSSFMYSLFKAGTGSEVGGDAANVFVVIFRRPRSLNVINETLFEHLETRLLF